MGHIHLGKLPQTQNWIKVIDLLRITDDPMVIAQATSKAAMRGLKLAKNDPGVIKTVLLLIKTTLAAKHRNFKSEFAKIGINIPPKASLLDVVSEFDRTLDKQMLNQGHRSDFAEMARQAAVEALTETCSKETGSLFGVSTEDTRQTLKKHSTFECSTNH